MSKIRALYSGLAGLVLAGAVLSQEPKTEVKTQIREAPVYSKTEVPDNYCSRYVRLAARDLFKIEYPNADAWKLRDASGVEEIKLNEKTKLESLAESGTLKEGILIGVYNPTSKYNGREDVKKAGYTHILLYLGKDENGKLWFADKFGKKTRKKTLEQLKKENGLVPVEVLYLKQ